MLDASIYTEPLFKELLGFLDRDFLELDRLVEFSVEKVSFCKSVDHKGGWIDLVGLFGEGESLAG